MNESGKKTREKIRMLNKMEWNEWMNGKTTATMTDILKMTKKKKKKRNCKWDFSKIFCFLNFSVSVKIHCVCLVPFCLVRFLFFFAEKFLFTGILFSLNRIASSSEESTTKWQKTKQKQNEWLGKLCRFVIMNINDDNDDL